MKLYNIIFLIIICVMFAGCGTTNQNSAQISGMNVIKDKVEIRWKSEKLAKYDIYWSAYMYPEPKWKKVHEIKGNGNEMVFIHPQSKKYNSGYYKIMMRE